MTFVVGLTGGVASGKSLAGAHFQSLGVPVLDADQVARQVVAPGSQGLTRVVENFGKAILDAQGGLDRRRMRERVFADEQAREELEAILHPLIREAMQGWKSACTTPYCVLMIPLLVKMGWKDLVHRLLVVDASEDDQLNRLTARDGIDAGLAQRMIAAQDTRQQRLDAADDVIRNTGSEGVLRVMVTQCHEAYLSHAGSLGANLPRMRLP